jgi:hypothetical protein
MTLRFDPTLSLDEIQSALRDAAGVAWGQGAVPEMESALETSARAIWRISQEPLEPGDVEP